MSEIMLEDLVTWERGLTFRPAAGALRSAERWHPFSWAVALRPTSPIIPTLRGGEIVVAPSRLMARLAEDDRQAPDVVLRALVGQPIAAVMVDQETAELAPAALPLLISNSPFGLEAEGVLNRLFTERRSELYRIGAELSRALSAAAMGGAGMDALPAAAESITGRAALLQFTSGTGLARSSRAPDALPQLPAAGRADLREPLIFEHGGTRWVAVRRTTDAAARGRELIIAVEGRPGGSTEVERLVLEQLGDTFNLVLRQLPARASNLDRAGREGLARDLLLGRLRTREALEARARLIGVEPHDDARVLLFRLADERGASRLRSMLAEDRQRIGVRLSSSEVALLLSGTAVELSGNDRQQLAQALHEVDPDGVFVIGASGGGLHEVPTLMRRARLLAQLRVEGQIPAATIDLSDVWQIGAWLLTLLLVDAPRDGTPPGSSVGGNSAATAQELVRSITTALVGPLREHDQRRHSDLVQTLAMYLRHGGALALAAEALGVHRNTLSYRLARIQDILGRDINDPAVRLPLQLALLVDAARDATSRLFEDEVLPSAG